MILAERAGQIAPETSDRKDISSRIEMPQRLLFNGIQHQGGNLSITATHNPALFIFSCPAAAILTFWQRTLMRADRADCAYFTVSLTVPDFCSLHIQKCLTTSNRSSRMSSASSGIPAFRFAMATCSSTVSTPSRFGSSRPRLYPRLTTTP